MEAAEMETIEIKKGKNPFILDGGIGRKSLIVTIAIIFITGFILFTAVAIYAQGVSEVVVRTKILPCLLVLTLFFSYIIAVTYIKRLYHILADKRKAVFYIVSAYIGITALVFTPLTLTRILGNIIPVIILIGLASTPGKAKLC